MNKAMLMAAGLGGLAFGVWLAGSPPTARAADEHGAHDTGSGTTMVAAAQAPSAWEQKFKEQLEREDTAEGRSGHRDQVETAMKKLMSEIAGDTNGHGAHTACDGQAENVRAHFHPGCPFAHA